MPNNAFGSPLPTTTSHEMDTSNSEFETRYARSQRTSVRCSTRAPWIPSLVGDKSDSPIRLPTKNHTSRLSAGKIFTEQELMRNTKGQEQRVQCPLWKFQEMEHENARCVSAYTCLKMYNIMIRMFRCLS